MPDLWWPNILGGLTEALVGGLIGFFIAYFTLKAQQTQKSVEYEVYSMPFSRFNPDASSSLIVGVRESMLTGQETEQESIISISNLDAFVVTVHNIGKQPIEDCLIEIELDEKAKIVGFSTEPRTRPGFAIAAERDKKRFNILRVSVPYINPKNKASIQLQSCENVSYSCKVNVLGMGVQVHKRSRVKVALWEVFQFFRVPIFVALGSLLLGSIYKGLQLMSEQEWLGKRIVLPDWPSYCLVLLSLVGTSWMFILTLRHLQAQERKE